MSDGFLAQPLFDGPIDLVGDVHGEIEPLAGLLAALGYDDQGRQPQNRRLVFVGDLVDRGPDSPSVVQFVANLVDLELAQCILGNHELNILLRRKKPENSWILADAPPLLVQGRLVPQRGADDQARDQIIAFFKRLPLVLERPGVRVAHACWHAETVNRVRHQRGVVHLYEQFRSEIDAAGSIQGWDDTQTLLAHQNLNPVKMLTSGPELWSEIPFFVNGKARHEGRLRWWNDYRDDAWCIFGHYWRVALDGEGGEHLFEGCEPQELNGPGSAYCLDFSVGKRYLERMRPDCAIRTRLAALRLPEELLYFDMAERPIPLSHSRK
jgi:hypothetical protein